MTSLETVKAYYNFFNEKNWEGMLSLLDDDIILDANQGGSQQGIDYFRWFLNHMDECYDEQVKNLVFMYEPTGTRIACEFVVHGVYKKTDGNMPEASGQVYILPVGAFFELNHGKITRVTTYYNLPFWIEMIMN
jgi:steroid delta-isomerase-like uncharacterized protein